MHESDVSQLSGSLGQRAGTHEGYWRELVPDARKSAAMRHIDW